MDATKLAETKAENNANEIKNDEKKETANFENEEIASTSKTDEPTSGSGIKSPNVENEKNKSSSVEEITVAFESCEVREISSTTEIHSNSNDCNKKEVKEKENASQSVNLNYNYHYDYYGDNVDLSWLDNEDIEDSDSDSDYDWEDRIDYEDFTKGDYDQSPFFDD